MRRVVMALVGIVAWALLVADPAGAAFGLKEPGFSFEEENGAAAVLAGRHPYALTTKLALNARPDPVQTEVPEDQIKDLRIDLPPGLAGNPAAVPRCASADFIKIVVGGTSCLNETTVGVAALTIALPFEPPTVYRVPVYNLEHDPGSAATLGFVALGEPVTIDVRVNPEPPYNLYASLANIPQAVRFFGSVVTVWGNPASAVHDKERGTCIKVGSCPVTLAEKPFLTLPRSCAPALSATFTADSWQSPGSLLEYPVQDGDPIQACSQLGFSPGATSQPTTRSAGLPSGLDFHLDVSDEGLTSPTGTAKSDLRKVVVTLPEGVTVNPSAAEGLGACGEADLARETAASEPGAGCPQASALGEVEVETPLLEGKLLHGQVFIATPYQNPFGSLVALYMVIKEPSLGIVLKVPGRVDLDPQTGRLTTTFGEAPYEVPQFPFSHVRFHFRDGARAPLVTPPACGQYTTNIVLTSWANPDSPFTATPTFTIDHGLNGGPCPSGGLAPFQPGLIAGTVNNSAGGFSPMSVRITRNDGEQEITGFSTQLPPGLTANLTDVPFCSQAQIAAAETRSGAQEQSEPSCPAASQIGHTLVGVGVGSVLAYTPGKLYMAGPFEGAPFSVVAITSAKVGPFDLGTVTVHLPLQIDPVTARVSIPAGAADQIPHIVKGIVVHVRGIRVYVDRQGFTLNPTNCEPLSLSATVYGAGQDTGSPADDVPSTATGRFQAADCANLAFKPSFKVSTSGKTSRNNGASLSVKLTYPKEALGKDANIGSVKVNLPKQLPSRLTTLQKACTAAQFEANPAGCPAASVVGQAKAITPILPVPIEGPAYFVSHGGAKFPELILVLQGYGITIDLRGETFISKAGITSSTFRTVPDQPVTSFELTLPQGPNSALAANGNLCSITSPKIVKKKVRLRSKNGGKRTITREIAQTVPGALTMPTTFTGQNGAVVKQNTQIEVTGCVKKKVKKAATSRRRHHRK